MSNADRTFVYTAQPSRVVFGRGSLGRLADEVKAVGAQKALVLCTPEQRKQAQVAADLLGPLSVGIYDGAQMHVPIESARKAREYSRSLGADCMVAIGGGSTIGLGKAIALESTVPIIAVPTTYAGSEMTPIYGITEDNVKKTGRDLRVLPKTVLYDPDLSATLPVRMSMVSGMNAIAHAAEGLYAKDGNPVMSLMAEEGMEKTPNDLIHIGKPIEMDVQEFFKQLEVLAAYGYANSEKIRDIVAAIVPTYHSADSDLKLHKKVYEELMSEAAVAAEK